VPRVSDVRIMTTVGHHSSETLFDDWRTMPSPRDGRSESDPSVMLGLVLVANTVLVAALVAAVVWLLA